MYNFEKCSFERLIEAEYPYKSSMPEKKVTTGLLSLVSKSVMSSLAEFHGLKNSLSDIEVGVTSYFCTHFVGLKTLKCTHANTPPPFECDKLQ